MNSTLPTLLQGVTQALAKSDANDKRQDHHEDECAERYREISRLLEKVSDALTKQSESFSAKLDKQTVNLNTKLYSIGITIIGGLIYAIYEALRAKGVL